MLVFMPSSAGSTTATHCRHAMQAAGRASDTVLNSFHAWPWGPAQPYACFYAIIGGQLNINTLQA
jgi:hypothetical protein